MEEPYEKELYRIFQSVKSVKNNELDQKGVNTLCETLHLDFGQRKQLWSFLDHNSTVSFERFRDALIYLANSGVKEENYSRDISPVREISPKYVFGEKKYGRRTKPQNDSLILNQSELVVQDLNSSISLSPRKLEFSNINSDLDYGTQNRDVLPKCDSKNILLKERSLMDKHNLSLACEHMGITSNGLISKSQLFDVIQNFDCNDKLFEKINEKYSNEKIPIKEVMELISHLDFRSVSPNSETSTSGVSSTSYYHREDNLPSTMMVNVGAIIELWESCGVPDPVNLLQELGIDISLDSLFIPELVTVVSNQLNKICNNSFVESSFPDYESINTPYLLLKALSSLNEYQVKWLKMIIEQMNCEREKLKYDVDVANNRAAMLAQEVDENHMRLEKSSADRIATLEHKHSEERKTLIDQWGLEKDQLLSQNVLLNNKLQQVQNYENELQSELLKNKKQISILESENAQIYEQLEETKEKNDVLEVQIQEIPQLRLKELELESINGQIIDLVEKIDGLKNENKCLRDQNDELVIELEATKRTDNLNADRSFDTNVRNFLVEENSPNCFGKVKQYMTESSAEDVGSIGTSETYTIESDFDALKKCQNIQNLDQDYSQASLVLVNNIKSTLSSQPQINLSHLNELIHYLENLKKVPKTDNSKVDELEKPLFLTHESSDGYATSSPLSKYPSRRSLNKQFEYTFETKMEDSSLIVVNNGSVEKLKQLYNKCKSDNLELQNKCNKIEKDWESRYNHICEVADKALDEAKRFKDECTDLENGMDALRNEYFECEEYWSLKLEEERKLNDLEKKISEDKLNDLESKIKEYSEMLEENKCSNKLPSINENAELEEQINCIQQEFSNYRMNMDEKIKNLKFENEQLKSQIITPVEKIDQEVPSCDFKEECEKCHENSKINSELKNKQFELKKNREKLGIECRSLLQRRSSLKNEVLKLQESLNLLSNTHKDLFARNEINQANKVFMDARKCKELEQRLHDEQMRHQKLTNAIWSEHQTKIDMAHKLLRTAQDKLEEQIKMRKEQSKQLLSADMIVKELFIENAKLTSVIHSLQTQIDRTSSFNSV